MANRQAKHWPMPIPSIQCLRFTHRGSSTVFGPPTPQKLQGSPSAVKCQRYPQTCEPKCDLLSVSSQDTLNPTFLPITPDLAT